jgi:hypothetical protein
MEASFCHANCASGIALSRELQAHNSKVYSHVETAAGTAYFEVVHLFIYGYGLSDLQENSLEL